MQRHLFAIPAALVAALGVAAATSQSPRSQGAPPAPAASHPPAAQTTASKDTAAQTQLVKQYCATCHNDRAKAGQLSLVSFDAATIEQHPELAEKMIRKLRTAMMPPAGAK